MDSHFRQPHIFDGCCHKKDSETALLLVILLSKTAAHSLSLHIDVILCPKLNVQFCATLWFEQAE